MKKEIQPKIYDKSVVTCACGNSFLTMSTMETLHVDICSACHPFYTGQRRFVDTERRIDKFNKKILLAAEKKQAVEVIKKAKEKKQKVVESNKDKSIKEILQEINQEEK